MKSFLLSLLIFMGTLNAQVPPPPPPQVPAVPALPPPNVGGPNTNPVPPHDPPPPQVSAAQAPPVTQVTPQQPPATPQYSPPIQQPPYNQYNPSNPYQQQPGLGMDPQNLNCQFGQCRNRRITLSPGQGFSLNCQQIGQCDGLDLTLNVGHDPTNLGSGVSDINDFNFDVPTNNVKIKINSVGGNNIEVNNIHCRVRGACNNLHISTSWGVEAHKIHVHCDQFGACSGCRINGQSCLIYSIMNGNYNGYMGYGYTNTLQQPQGGPPLPQQTYNGQPLPQFQPYPQWI